MHIDPMLLKCTCDNKKCSVFSKCCFLPTECNCDPSGNVSILFVGQGGGKDERKMKRPFIGRAGTRLRQQVLYVRKTLKQHIGVAFSNTIRDNPENNRIPTQEELDSCLVFLFRDIASLMKLGLKVVIPLGNAAKLALIKTGYGSMAADRGVLYKLNNDIFGQIAVLPTYHPSYLIRNVPKFNDSNPSDLDKIVINDIIKAYNISVEDSAFDTENNAEISLDL